MKTYRYNIAGHFCGITFLDEYNDDRLLSSFAPFATRQEGGCLFDMTVDDTFSFVQEGKKVGLFDCGGNKFGVYQLPDGSYQYEIYNVQEELCALLQASPDFTECKVALKGSTEDKHKLGLNNALMLVYAFASAPYHTLLMHASVVRNGGMGYLFLGKSGTGKSTHTSLWLKHIPGSDLMNDDNPVVRVENGRTKVYGSPWSGKTPCYRNVSAWVGAFVQLQQSPENAIRKQNVLESFASLLPSVSSMKWDRRIYGSICDTLEELIRMNPIYCLECRPDEAAARLSYQILTQG